MSIRKTFIMKLNPGFEEEYKKRHDELCPEMKKLLKVHGVHNYSISLYRDTNQLFGYAEIDSEEQWRSLADTDECQRWWAYMKDIMETNPDNSPVSTELKEVFYLA